VNAGGKQEQEQEQEHRESRETAVPVREQVNPQHCWNTADIYPDSKAWFRDHDRLKTALKQFSAYRTTLGDSPRQLLSGLESWFSLHHLREKLEVFAFLNRAADGGCRENQQIDDQIRITAAEVEQAAGFFEPEILDLDPGYIEAAFQQEPGLLQYKRVIDTIIRRKPHILTEREEKLTALWDGTRITRKAFTELVTADLDFGMVENVPLTRANLSRFLIHPDREVRRQAYLRTYKVYDQHKHTLAALYEGSIRRDVVSARTRKYTSCREMALFPDAVPEQVYDSLIGAVRKRLPEFHDFFRMRKNQLGVSILRPYDLSVPLVPQPEISFSYEQAVDLIIESLRPFPTSYTDVLRNGLLSGWVDRYENRGKQAGAFTAGYYGSGSEKDGGSLVHPYILVNYKPEVLRNLFTLAHESGHAMHTWYSIKNNHFSCYQYSILEAETAANVHEFMLYRHLIAQAQDSSQKAFFLERQLGDLIAKLLRQTMLAEFEHMIHREAEEDRPITTEVLRKTFRDLAADYYGPEVISEAVSDLEGLTIPHLHTRYYVYTYPLGASAALVLVDTIAAGKEATAAEAVAEEKGAAADRYLEFLKSGGSRDPADALRIAGVDILDSFILEKALDYTVRLMRDYRQLR
jgi:oligoendopeptidase F